MQLDVEKANFKVSMRSFKLLVNEQRREDVTLQVGGPDVMVTSLDAEATPLKKESASLGTVIENRQVTALPLDGRNFYELGLLVPGAVPPAQGSAGSVRGDFAFSVNGAREDANNFLLDGVYNLDPKLNTFGVRPSVDAIREFEISDEHLRCFVWPQSGCADQRHSRLRFEPMFTERCSHFIATQRSMRATSSRRPIEPKPKYIRNQFGGAIGGPIVRDRTFFFADYEGTRSREGITRITNVPTAAERAGRFFAKSVRRSNQSVHGPHAFRWRRDSVVLYSSGRTCDCRALSAAEQKRSVSKLRLFAGATR